MKIRIHPDPALRLQCDHIVLPVIERESYEEIVHGMVSALRKARGVGLAAPQVGIAMQLVVIDPARTGAPCVMFNPIRDGLGEEWKWGIEGCLSLPGQEYRVRRRKAVSVEWRTMEGKPRSKRFDGWAARVVQHELDHLQGILIADHGRLTRRKR